jgi:hypothetical protein
VLRALEETRGTAGSLHHLRALQHVRWVQVRRQLPCVVRELCGALNSAEAAVAAGGGRGGDSGGDGGDGGVNAPLVLHYVAKAADVHPALLACMRREPLRGAAGQLLDALADGAGVRELVSDAHAASQLAMAQVHLGTAREAFWAAVTDAQSPVLEHWTPQTASNVVYAYSRLVSLGALPRPDALQHAAMVAIAARFAPACNAHEVAQLAHALGKLRAPFGAARDALVAAAASLAPTMRPVHLQNTLFGFADAGEPLGSAGVALRVATARLASALDPGEAAGLLAALAKLPECTLGEARVPLLAAVAAGAHELSGGRIASVLHACAELRESPAVGGGGILCALTLAAPAMSPHDTSATLAALARLAERDAEAVGGGEDPIARLALGQAHGVHGALRAALARTAPAMDPPHLCEAAVAAARLRIALDDARAPLASAAARAWRGLSGAGHAALLWALRRCGINVLAEHLDSALWEAAALRAAEGGPVAAAHLSRTLYALAQHHRELAGARADVDAARAAPLVAAAAACAHDMTPQAAALSACALAELGAGLGVAAAPLGSVALRSAGSLPPRILVDTLAALAAAGAPADVVGGGVVAAVAHVVSSTAPAAEDAYVVANALSALATLQAPCSAYAAPLLHAAARLAPAMTNVQAAQARKGLLWLQAHAADDVDAALLAHAHSALQQREPQRG